MKMSFRGRVVQSSSLIEIEDCIEKYETVNGKLSSIVLNIVYENQYKKLCEVILGNFRDVIETEEERRYKLPLEKNLIGGNQYSYKYNLQTQKFIKGTEQIELNFKDGFADSIRLESSDLLLGSMGHELGHFYVNHLSDKYNLTINGKWNELISDFTGGFLFGLDQDNDAKTRDLDISGRLNYFSYLAVYSYGNARIPGTSDGFFQILDGVHPFVAARNAAIKMGFDKGCEMKNARFPIGLNRLANIYNEFMDNYYNTYIETNYFKDIQNKLIVYNEGEYKKKGMEATLKFLDLSPNMAKQFTFRDFATYSVMILKPKKF